MVATATSSSNSRRKKAAPKKRYVYKSTPVYRPDLRKKHKPIRCFCPNCNSKIAHSAKEHQSHGEGSFKKIHPGYCKKFTCHTPGTKKYKRKKRQTGCKGYEKISRDIRAEKRRKQRARTLRRTTGAKVTRRRSAKPRR